MDCLISEILAYCDSSFFDVCVNMFDMAKLF